MPGREVNLSGRKNYGENKPKLENDLYGMYSVHEIQQVLYRILPSSLMPGREVNLSGRKNRGKKSN